MGGIRGGGGSGLHVYGSWVSRGSSLLPWVCLVTAGPLVAGRGSPWAFLRRELLRCLWGSCVDQVMLCNVRKALIVIVDKKGMKKY